MDGSPVYSITVDALKGEGPVVFGWSVFYFGSWCAFGHADTFEQAICNATLAIRRHARHEEE